MKQQYLQPTVSVDRIQIEVNFLGTNPVAPAGTTDNYQDGGEIAW